MANRRSAKLEKRIEKKRAALKRLVQQRNYNLQDRDVMAASVELDGLLNRYYDQAMRGKRNACRRNR